MQFACKYNLNRNLIKLLNTEHTGLGMPAAPTDNFRHFWGNALTEKVLLCIPKKEEEN